MQLIVIGKPVKSDHVVRISSDLMLEILRQQPTVVEIDYEQCAVLYDQANALVAQDIATDPALAELRGFEQSTRGLEDRLIDWRTHLFDEKVQEVFYATYTPSSEDRYIVFDSDVEPAAPIVALLERVTGRDPLDLK